MKLSEAVAFRTKQILKEKQMSQYQLEKISTIHHGTMTDLMQGVYKTVNLKTVMLIIKAFDMKTHEFFNSPIFDSDDLEID